MRRKRKGSVFYPLNSDIRLHTAMIDQSRVVAFQDRDSISELIGIGRIVRISDGIVTLYNSESEEKTSYMRSSCTFCITHT